MKIASYSVDSNNLGDHIQIIAQLRLLEELGIEPEIYLDRDCGIQPVSTDNLLLVMNGWHKRSGHIWPPSDNIIPLFIGFHARNRRGLFDNVTNRESIDYLKRNEPIGCRDEHTFNLLRECDIKCYISNCLTTTLPRREQKETQTKIFVASRDKDILNILPESISSQCEYINHYSCTSDFHENMILARELLDNYKNNAKLVVTTFLHCALPCIAMGIPVIVFYPNFDANSPQHLSDKQRMSTLANMTKCYLFEEIEKVNWNIKALDTENQKQKLIQDFNLRIHNLLT